MEEENKKDVPELTLDEEAQVRLLVEANAIQRGTLADTIEVDGKRWHLRPMGERQLQLIENLDYDILYWQRKLKEAQTSRKAKRLNGKIHKAFAKKAAHRILGKRLWLVPGLYALMWRRLYYSSARITATVNASEGVSENKVFSLANWGSSKQVLARSMPTVGEAVKERTLRGESAESMVERDGLPKKEDSRSEARSGARRTTRR